MLQSIRRGAENEIREAHAAANETKLRAEMEQVIAEGDESVFKDSRFQIDRIVSAMESSSNDDQDIGFVVEEFGFDSKFDDVEELATLSGSDDEATITVEVGDVDEFTISSSDGYDSVRKVYRDGDKSVIENQNFTVHETGNGTGTLVFARQVSAAISARVARIETYAARGEGMNGYYTWPRLGYDAPVPDEVTLPAKFEGVERISQLMMTPDGRDWWKENGVSTGMTFDLNEGSLSRKVLALSLIHI